MKKIICGCKLIKSGLQLKTIFKIIDRVDTELEEHLDFAFSPKLGDHWHARRTWDGKRGVPPCCICPGWY